MQAANLLVAGFPPAGAPVVNASLTRALAGLAGVRCCWQVVVRTETERERGRRRHRRTLFDAIAPAYDEYRLGYPPEITEFVLGTAGVGPGSDVLEVGCGTGQLTEMLAGRGFRLTVIDIGPSMIAAARRRLDSAAVSFQVTSFEDFTAAGASFDLIASGAAYHWVDPEARFAKLATLLRPGGWLALLGYDERYDDPLGAALLGHVGR